MANESFIREFKQFILETVAEGFQGLTQTQGSAIDETNHNEERASGEQGQVKHPESDRRLKQNRGAA